MFELEMHAQPYCKCELKCAKLYCPLFLDPEYKGTYTVTPGIEFAEIVISVQCHHKYQ